MMAAVSNMSAFEMGLANTNDNTGQEDAFCGGFSNYAEIDHSDIRTHNANTLHDALLIQSLENAPNALAMMTPKSTNSHIKQETRTSTAEGSPVVQNLLLSEQMRAASPSLRGNGLRSPLSHVQRAQTPANASSHALGYRNQHLRFPSNLRNQFNPDILYQTSSPSLSSYGTVPYATPPAQNIESFQYYGAPNTMLNSVRQPFDESNIRSPLHQSYGLSMSNQSGSHIYPVYPYQQSYPPSGQLCSPFMNVNTHFGQPRTPPRMTNMGEFQYSPNLNGSGSSVTRRLTPQSSPMPQVKRENGTGKRARTAAHRNKSEDELDLIKLPRTVSEEDAPLVRRLIAAMTDGSAAEDNDGMKKTWDKIRKTREPKVHDKAIEMLVRRKKLIVT